ncbi:MAG: hypothetical protein IPO61_05880, partial [Gammaproteobacteria bacterium]|nr:hypothetical protein [Gammaproteobacteria bacterium]
MGRLIVTTIAIFFVSLFAQAQSLADIPSSILEWSAVYRGYEPMGSDEIEGLARKLNDKSSIYEVESVAALGKRPNIPDGFEIVHVVGGYAAKEMVGMPTFCCIPKSKRQGENKTDGVVNLPTSQRNMVLKR